LKTEIIQLEMSIKLWYVIVNLITSYYPSLEEDLLEDDEFLSHCSLAGYEKEPKKLIPEIKAEIVYSCLNKVFPVSIMLLNHQWHAISHLLDIIYDDLYKGIVEDIDDEEFEEQLFQIDAILTSISFSPEPRMKKVSIQENLFVFEKPD